jgi:hypothetical protein
MTLREDRGISVIPNDIPYKDFLDEYLRPLKPCLFSSVTESWPAVKQWTEIDSRTRTLIPNFSNLKVMFGENNGCVTFCNEYDVHGDTVQREMTVGNFLDNLLSNSGNDFFNTSRKTYLKDFHFMLANPDAAKMYDIPVYFQGLPSPS